MKTVTEQVIGLIASPRIIEFEWMSIAAWHQLFQQHQKIAIAAGQDLLFLGDSLTENWDKAVFNHYFTGYSSANFGIGGDHTGNLLWRLENISFGKLAPKLIVLQIGVNNIGHLAESAQDIFHGIKKVVDKCQQQLPNSKILLHGVFPFEQQAEHLNRATVANINQLIATLADEQQIFFRDYGALLLQPDGSISAKVMADYLHPTPVGYDLWAQALLPDIKQILSGK
ncbi:MAG: GDSL-type esterase/lipase family protein [Thalassotalea sp.]